MTPEKLDELVDKKLSELIKGKPVDFIMVMLIRMGQMCVETNAETMDLSQQSTINNQRYQIKCKITVKKVKPTPHAKP